MIRKDKNMIILFQKVSDLIHLGLEIFLVEGIHTVILKLDLVKIFVLPLTLLWKTSIKVV